ncbi:alcohol dehydrogenase class IV [Salsuginibacillus halophilus]|uniref:Alcohol dehydrogenase class IV n=1 Tax=Salsuginibacillus halophilus TaxID=517424 RepID=A0A2P8H8P8_9BACI|nr:iron-containing alcohol dehydrogenase [Salsuginibacillus halophilus]PSL42592.1 alcohol dehydrogenase class IV [Salsuginibacillus halophilus]
MYTLYCRGYQQVMKQVARFISWRRPALLAGRNSLQDLTGLLRSNEYKSVLIVTDASMEELPIYTELLDVLKAAGADYVIYNRTVPNPTIVNVEEAYALYQSARCDAILAFGGGSPMDCAKGAAARAARPKKEIPQMKGQLKVRKQVPPLIAVPTTAGTGSEATVTAVISNPETKEKYSVNDPVLIPDYAVLDPVLTSNLPAPLTAATGMDALTHAVEAYLNRGGTAEVKSWCEEAVSLIFNHLYSAYREGNLESREAMQQAAHVAGLAFTRNYVGYVHAIAHTLGGFYHVPHGLANAVILPHVLRYYGEPVHDQLAALADAAGLVDKYETAAVKAESFIKAVEELNEAMGIPAQLNDIQKVDIPFMVERATAEANPLYPVPVILRKKDLTILYHRVKAG